MDYTHDLYIRAHHESPAHGSTGAHGAKKPTQKLVVKPLKKSTRSEEAHLAKKKKPQTSKAGRATVKQQPADAVKAGASPDSHTFADENVDAGQAAASPKLDGSQREASTSTETLPTAPRKKRQAKWSLDTDAEPKRALAGFLCDHICNRFMPVAARCQMGPWT